jgi:hypothetical protein
VIPLAESVCIAIVTFPAETLAATFAFTTGSPHRNDTCEHHRMSLEPEWQWLGPECRRHRIYLDKCAGFLEPAQVSLWNMP